MTTAINLADLAEALKSHSEAFANAEPFPHVMLDGLLDTELLRTVASEFPDGTGMEATFTAPHEDGKGQTSSWGRLGPESARLIAALNSGEFVEALEQLSGIEHLVADTKLEGGGLHRTGRGGHLGVHADFSRHSDNGLHRRLNLLLYLNDDWDEAWGGHLELWDREMTEAVVRVAPTMGRVVVFATTSESFHGHPDPIRCPEDRARKSIALYYYSNDHRDEDLEERHSTLFQARPGSIEDERRDRDTATATRRAQFAKRWLPPAVAEAAKKAKQRLARS